MIRLLLVLLFGCCGAIHAETPLKCIAKNGKSDYVIVLAKDAIPAERTAAFELQKYINQISGVKLKMVKPDETSQLSKRIFIGWSNKVKKLIPNIDFSSMKSDRIIIKTIGNDLVLTGGRPRGTLYAVYTFLENVLGVRWWTSSAEFVPKQKTLGFPEINIDYTPVLSDFRMTFYQDVNRNPSFAAKLKSHGFYQNYPLKWGGYLKVDPYPSHTYFRLLPPDKYFAEHPEWYSADKAGKRFHKRGQLCETNPEMAKEITKIVKELRSKSGSSSYVAIAPMDWQGACQCAKCLSIAKKEGSRSGSMIQLANYVGREVAKKYPDTQIVISAYDYCQTPPKNIKCAENVIIKFTTSKFSMFHLADSLKNKNRFSNFLKWKNLNPNSRFWIWDYNAVFSDFLQPFPNYSITPNNIKIFVNNGASGIMAQGASNCPVGDFVAMRAWIIGHLLWNPKLKYEKLEDEFLRGYYGKAAPALKKYLRMMESNVKAKGVDLDLNNKSMEFLTPDILVKGAELFAEALKAVKDDITLRTRVEEAEITLIYAILISTCVEQKTKISDFPALKFKSKTQAIDWFENFLNKYKHLKTKEALYATSSKLIKLLRNASKFKRSKNEFQEAQATLYDSKRTKVIECPKASNSLAVKITGDTNRWLLRYNLPKTFKLDKKATLNAVVRCDIANELPPDTPIFKFGYCGSGKIITKTVLKKDINNDGEYHVYSILLSTGVTPRQSKAKTKYFWLAPQGKDRDGKIRYITCDKMSITYSARNVVFGENLLSGGFEKCQPGSLLPVKDWRFNYNLKAKGKFIKDVSFKGKGPALELVNPVADKAVTIRNIPFVVKEPGTYCGSVYIKPGNNAQMLPKKKLTVIMRTIRTDWKKGFYSIAEEIQKDWLKYEYEFSVPKSQLGKYFFRIDIIGSGTFYIAEPSLNMVKKQLTK